MAKIVFGMNVSLDGYVDHDAFPPGPDLFQHWIAHVGSLSGSVYGRGLYELMRYWDDDQPGWTDEEHAFAAAWRRQPKWVVSRTLTSVGPNATLVTDDAEGLVRRLKAERTGEIDLGGPVLAGSLAGTGLIDEYHLYYRPAVLGHGRPFFVAAVAPLRLLASDRIGVDTVRLTYTPG